MRSHSHEHSPREPLRVLTERLRENDLKITGPRRAILEILREHPHPLTNKEILGALPADRACDLVTVYRSMHKLEELGIVKRYDFGDATARYELVGQNDDGHHHHLICTECSDVVEIEECFTSELEQRIAAQNGFSNITHKLEFFGTCPTCATSN